MTTTVGSVECLVARGRKAGTAKAVASVQSPTTSQRSWPDRQTQAISRATRPRSAKALVGDEWLMTRAAVLVLFVALLISGGARTLRAQTGTATLSGTIMDPNGRVVPDADVNITNIDTNTISSTKTNGDGVYVLTALPPGRYRLIVTKQGFKQVALTDITLNTQDSVSRNFSLEVGAVSETVTVNANDTQMETTSPAVGLLVDRTFVENMPLNGRSFQDLLALAPGAVASYNPNGGGGPAGYYSIDGQRSDSNNFTVDGVSANTDPGIASTLPGPSASGSLPASTALGTTQSLISVDDLQEFRAVTSTYSAELGRQPGGQIGFTSRSGTNEWHGSAFDYFRNEALDAKSYYEDTYGLPKPPERQNDFGGTVGGPLSLPHLYEGQDRTFFFFSYEGLRLRLPEDDQEDDPTVAFRQSVAPTMQPFLNSFPVPNGPTNADGLTAQFNTAYSVPNDINSVSLRIDHNFSQSLQGFVRYSRTSSDALSRTYHLASNVTTSELKTQGVTSGLTYKISDNAIDEFRFNYTYNGGQKDSVMDSYGGAVPYPNSAVYPVALANAPGVKAGVLISLFSEGVDCCVTSTIGGYVNHQNQFNIVDNISWALHTHLLKFGVDFRRLHPSFSQNPFDGQFSVRSLSNLQQGIVDSIDVYAFESVREIFDNLSLYAQDDWRVSSRFTLDYGLRWEFNPVPGPSNGVYPLAVTQTNNLATMQLAPTGTPLYHTRYDDFAPRLGFAYQVVPSQSHPLVVRGGAGIFYDTGQNLAATAFGGYPFSAYQQTSNVVLPAPPAALGPPSLNIPLTVPYGYLSALTDPNLRLPYTEQWSLSVDEGLSAKNTLTVSYVGNEGKKLLYTEAYYGLGAINPSFSAATIVSNGSASSYNALQVQDSGYISNGLQVIASYAWAHARDNQSTETSYLQPIWGNSDFDIRQVFNAAVNYEIPGVSNKGSLLGKLTNGWLVANRLTAQTGLPFVVTQGSFSAGVGQIQYTVFPDLLSGVPIYLHGVAGIPGGWQVNPQAFSLVPTDPNTGAPLEPSNLGRNFLHGPSFWNLNTSVERTFGITERLKLKFRVDAFNIFNHPNFGIVNNFFSPGNNPQFGQLYPDSQTMGSSNALYATGSARSLQISLKLQF